MNTRIKSEHKGLTMAAALLGLTMAGAAAADVISGSSSGYGAYVNLNTLGTDFIDLTVSPIPMGATGTAPAPYNVDDSVLSLDVSDSACLASFLGVCTDSISAVVQSELLSGHAESDVDGGSGNRLASATGTANNIMVEAGTGTVLNLISTPVLGLSATTLSSSALVSGDQGMFTATGSSIIEGASLNLAGLDLITLDGNAAPNTLVDPLGSLSLLGLTVVLNEQVSSCSQTECDIAVNALHMIFNDFALGTELLNGEIIFGHSEASLSAVPVPAAVWLFGSGLAGLVGIARRRRNA